jgi:hypothetical protein
MEEEKVRELMERPDYIKSPGQMEDERSPEFIRSKRDLKIHQA